MKKTISLTQCWLTVLSVSCLLIANVVTAKQMLLPLGVTMTGAVVVFPITYILSDVFSEVYGYKWSRITCYMGFAMNILMVAVFEVVIASKAPDYWDNQGAFQSVLGSAPRVLTASLLAFVAGDFVNDKVFDKMKLDHIGHDGFGTRAILSSFFGELTDSIIFIPIAFFGEMPVDTLFTMLFTQVLLKTAYGGQFFNWMFSDEPEPYNSFGNGAAMRVSPCGLAAQSIDEAIAMARAVTEVTHNHPEGMKGAEATAVAVFMAKSGYSKIAIQNHIADNYYLNDFTLDSIRQTYHFNETCQESVPQAFQAFFESSSYIDCIRRAISIGGDSDTIAAIAGSIAGAYYSIPFSAKKIAMNYLTDELKDIVIDFEEFKHKKDMEALRKE